MTKKQFVQSERQFTVELLKKLTPNQWQASTLCAGWTIEDLAAHLVSRERNIIGSIGLVVPGLHFVHDKRIEKIKAKGHQFIISRLERYPWWMAATLNTAEFYVHNEDMLRGELHLHRTPPSEAGQAILWSALAGLMKVKKTMVKDLGNVMIENTHNSDDILIANHHSKQDTTIRGQANELLLFCYGRRAAAKVKVKQSTL